MSRDESDELAGTPGFFLSLAKRPATHRPNLSASFTSADVAHAASGTASRAMPDAASPCLSPKSHRGARYDPQNAANTPDGTREEGHREEHPHRGHHQPERQVDRGENPDACQGEWNPDRHAR